MNMEKMNERQLKILEILDKNGKLTIEEAVKKFGVSEMTIRRDFTQLEDLGYARRIAKGVISNKKWLFAGTFHQREKTNVDEKKAIAREAVKILSPGENIIIDTGTTTLYFARELEKINFSLTVATTSLAVASALFNTDINVLIFGGFLRREIPDVVGPLTEKNLQYFHADKLFMGCDGLIVEEGLFTSDLNISHIEEKMVEISDEVIILADSTKLGRKSFTKYADISSVSILITDSKAPMEYIEKIQSKGVEVIIAQV